MKKWKFIPYIVVLLLLAAMGFGSFYTLDNAQEAVIERFGKLVSSNTEAGLHFKLPFIDAVHVYNTNEILSLQYGYRIKSEDAVPSEDRYSEVDSEANVLTKGSYLINIGAVIQYKITDPVYYHYKVRDQESTIRLAFESVLRSNVQNQLLDDALVNKDLIAREILPDLIEKLNRYELGITVVDVKLTDVLLPENVQFAYDDVNIATNEKDAFKSRADKYANEKLPSARAEAYKQIQAAEAYKAEKIAQAKGDTENFNQVYERYVKAKDITTTRMYVETMEKILKKTPNKYIINTEDDGLIKYLPLPSGLQNVPQSTTQGAEGGAQ